MLGTFNWRLKAPLAVLLGTLLAGAHAQGGYQITEDFQTDPATADAGPVRMARISFVQGTVSWRPTSDDSSSWSEASVNLPLRQGAQIWVADHSRAEIQFDDGSTARLGSVVAADGGVATLQTLYSDSKGEFTELSLSSGLLSLRLTNPHSLYQVDTSALTAKSYGEARFRVGVGQGVEVVNHFGGVAVTNNASKLILEPRQNVYASDTDAQMEATVAPQEDGWDQFVDSRDEVMYGHAGYVPSSFAICAGNIGGYGSWGTYTSYPHIWYPRVEAGWAPYRSGHWVYVQPFGWTWVGGEAWGWAPYHYGTWINTSSGWGWVPGPAVQCWSPAVVHFCSYNGAVAWCALAPSEVHYASIGVGINLGGGFSLGFSIGTVGCYYPASNNYCEPRTFNNVTINRVTNITNVTTINNYYGGAPQSNYHFVPQNSNKNGASSVQANNFGRAGGTPQPLRGGTASQTFQRGQSFGGGGGKLVSGPPGVQVSRESFTPSHSLTARAPSSTVLSRPVLRPNLPPSIAKVSAPAHAPTITPHPVTGHPNRMPVRTTSPRTTPPTRMTPPARTTPPTRMTPPARTTPPARSTPPTRSTPPARTIPSDRPSAPKPVSPSRPNTPSHTPPAHSTPPHSTPSHSAPPKSSPPPKKKGDDNKPK